MSPHSATLSCFRANQSLLFLLNAVCLARSNKYQCYGLCFYPSGLEPTIYCTRSEHAGNVTNKEMATPSAACRKEKVEPVYIKSKCGHIILLDTINYWTYRNFLESLYFRHQSRFFYLVPFNLFILGNQSDCAVKFISETIRDRGTISFSYIIMIKLG